MLKLSPRDFDFPRKPVSNHYHIGPLVDHNRENVITDSRYLAVLKTLSKLKASEKNLVMIYCSLGTVTDDDIKLCDIFFKKIADMARSNSHYQIVLSVGLSYNVNRLLPKPVNLYIFQQVPQIDLLSRCDLMINHGGINSISECVFAGVPMLVFPLSSKWDQNGCAARVVFHGLGLRGIIKTDSQYEISNKIESVLKNYDRYKANVLKMRTKFSLFNSSQEAVSILEDMVGYG
jgi:UDP:flavonoid glycosyltransferase YjiC (YdhE family)